MRLATLKLKNPRTVSERLDGRLCVVSEDGRTAALVPQDRYPTLLSALEQWEEAQVELGEIDKLLRAGKSPKPVDLAAETFMAPLPRTWAWLDGSAFIQHILLVRKARGAESPEDLKTVPLMYQGVSDNLLGPNDDVPLVDEAHGMDFESEVAVVVDRVPMGTKARDAESHIKLLLLMNDVSLRNLIPRELAAGFGFFHGKPASSFSPYAISPDELGPAWKDGRVHLELRTSLNGTLFGRPNAGEMHFSFHQLIEHAAKTRELSPGTILGSGTVSNADASVGSSCLAEKRMIEKIETGKIKTPFLKAGDVVEIEMLSEGRTLFGAIRQTIVQVS